VYFKGIKELSSTTLPLWRVFLAATINSQCGFDNFLNGQKLIERDRVLKVTQLLATKLKEQGGIR
jgi:hypothetical protein